MTNRENLIESLEGRTPERIPFTTYADFGFTEPELSELVAMGFTQAQYASVVDAETPEVERVVEKTHYNGRTLEMVTLRTSIGSISQTSLDGWIQSYFLKSPKDYSIMEYIVRNTSFLKNYDAFGRCEERAGDDGITLIALPRSPMQTILVDYAGLERLAYHMDEDMCAVSRLAEALFDNLAAHVAIIADGPGRYVHMTENMTAETWGGERFRRFHKPVYDKILPVLHRGGKKLYAHYDGKLKSVVHVIGETSMDGVESFSEPPEGDMTYREIRSALPGKYIWSNISLNLFLLPDGELRQWVREAALSAAPDKRLFALAILEDIPPNWREKIPVILDALEEIS